ncbi:MAG: phosphate/phosphite/phosphonate ABC transporter substrate-binding protein [Armatimonadota bacterium]
MDRPVLIGAVAYDQRVVPIWEGMRDYFREAGLPIDYVLYSNYDRQVEALLSRQIDIAWNTNLAWVKVCRRTGNRCRALAMRDVDAEFKTVFVARTDSGIESLADLRGKRLALGSADSGQAAILPVEFLREAGVDAERECRVLRFNLDVGKHGDTGTSELEVLRALRDGEADAGAMGDTTWIRQVTEGRVDPRQVRAIWTSPGYCHCNFTVLEELPEELGRRWTETLLRMTYDQPQWRELMDLEGLKRWLESTPEIMTGYAGLFEAVERQGLTEKWPS